MNAVEIENLTCVDGYVPRKQPNLWPHRPHLALVSSTINRKIAHLF